MAARGRPIAFSFHRDRRNDDLPHPDRGRPGLTPRLAALAGGRTDPASLRGDRGRPSRPDQAIGAGGAGSGVGGAGSGAGGVGALRPSRASVATWTFDAPLMTRWKPFFTSASIAL